tara:strand:- start:26 stop:847 length:822 start_codon:yes stop_codon:yes gene_type:complete
MRTIITLLITVLSINSFGQKNTNISDNVKYMLKRYYPKNEILYKKVNNFYDSLANCYDTSTVDWLLREQSELSALLASNFDLNKIVSEGLTTEQIVKDLNQSLFGFEFNETDAGDFHLLVYSNMQFLFEQTSKQLFRGEPDETRLKIEDGFDIVFQAWGHTKYDYTTYCYDICCDCAQESALGSGLHSRLLTAIIIYTAHSNLFSEALKKIKQGIKNDVLYTYAFSRPKSAIIAEFKILKHLLELSEEEVYIYEKKRIYLEETSESGLHNYGR